LQLTEHFKLRRSLADKLKDVVALPTTTSNSLEEIVTSKYPSRFVIKTLLCILVLDGKFLEKESDLVGITSHYEKWRQQEQ